PNTVQTARHRVPAAAELSTRVQNRQHDLDRGLLLLLVLINRNAAAVVEHADAAIREHRDVDRVAVPRESLIHRVIDNLVDEVVETSRTRRPDVHTRSLANRFEPFENLDLVCAVTGFGL